MIKPSLISKTFAIMPFLRTLGFIFILFGQVNISLASNATGVKSCSEHLMAIIKSAETQRGADFLLSKNSSRHTSPDIARAQSMAKAVGLLTSAI